MSPRSDQSGNAAHDSGGPSAAASPLPQPLPELPDVPEPRDEPFDGTILLRVDASDVERRIYRVRETIPVPGAGPMLLLYPKWLPGFHAPQAPIELFAGLVIRAGDEELVWKRHPVTINAFHVDVPDGVAAIEAEFQFLSPTDASQGRVVCTPDLLGLQWNTVLLYPAGHFARRITVAPSLTLPDGWRMACALDLAGRDGGTWRFEPTSLDVLVDSPVFAGRHSRRIELDADVHLTVFAELPEWLEASEEQIAAHRGVVEQADRLFRSRHFDRFEMLLALSDEMTSAGIEHHRSFEAVSIPGYFTNWAPTFARRDTVPHEYVHSWNGKHRRGADSWQPCFEKPIRNSLMWVYEGQTQYWSRVLAARSGLWTREQALGALAVTAARYQLRPGSQWRPTIDTTRDPIIAARAPLPWPSWQRSEDYYSEGSLIWLDVDTRLRELSGERRSLDDFARAFFGEHDGNAATDTYTTEDVFGTLDGIAPFDWAGFFRRRLTETHDGAPLAGLERGGYRLVFRDHPNVFETSSQAVFGSIDLSHSLGLSVTPEGKITDVLWGGPAFDAGLTIGGTIAGVNDRGFSPDLLRQAITEAASTPVRLLVSKVGRIRPLSIPCSGGLRHPHLERIEGTPARLDAILSPLETIGGREAS